MELSNLPHMNSTDELPASTGSKDVAWIRWLLEFKALHCGFEEAMRVSRTCKLKSVPLSMSLRKIGDLELLLPSAL